MVRDRGAGKDSIGKAKGLFGLLWGAMSHSPMSSIPPQPKKCHQSPSATISVPPPQEHKEAAPEASAPAVKKSELAQEVPSTAAPEALEMVIPANMTPLCLQLGCIKRVYKCQVENCSEGPSTTHTTICAYVHKDHLGVRLAYPSCDKSFFNSDAPTYHEKSHISQ